MNTYTVTVEHAQTSQTIKAKHGVDCIKAFVAENPKTFEGDAVYLLLHRQETGVTIRFLVRHEQRSRPPQIELIGIA
jgi:hypothetical protein